MSEPDLKPETEEPPKNDPPEPPKNNPPEPAPSNGPSNGGEIPQWGQDLSNKLDGLIEALKPPMPPDGHEVDDVNPVRKPWHKRGFFGGES